MANIQHKLLPADECHESKQIIGALTSDAGKIITPSATTAGTGELRQLKDTELLSVPLVLGPLTTQTVDMAALNPTPPNIIINVAAAAIVTVQLPAASGSRQKRITVGRSVGGSGLVLVTAPGGALISGWPSLWLRTQHECVTLVTDGTTWRVAGKGNNTQGHYQWVRDGQYTSGSPLNVLAGVRTRLTIDNVPAGQENYVAPGLDLWDATNNLIKFTQPGDILRCRLAIRCSAGGASNYFDLEATYSGVVGNTVVTELLNKSGGAENRIIRQVDFFLDNSALTHAGLELWVTPNVNMSFWGVTLLIAVASNPPIGSHE